LYYSLLDWSHPDYPNFTKTQKRYERDSIPEAWERFVRFNKAQIAELMTRYHPDLMWFDGDWEQSAEAWQAAEIREMLHKFNNNIIINSRLQGYGDYATPEQGIPVSKPKDEYWELCMTMNDSWGYQPNDQNYKPVNLIIRIFADVIGMGGSLLLDIGPKADGSIPEEQVNLLKELGRWTGKHAEAIYGTRAGVPKDCYYGPSTLSADSSTLFLFIPNNRAIEQSNPSPTVLQSYSLTVLLKGIPNKINSIWVVGNGTKLEQKTWLKPWWSGNPGLVEISIPEAALDGEMTVIALQLEGKISIKF
jgi:alpha-L-fucosidase